MVGLGMGTQGVTSLLTLKGRSKVMISTNLWTPPLSRDKTFPIWKVASDLSEFFPHMEGALGISHKMTPKG